MPIWIYLFRVRAFYSQAKRESPFASKSRMNHQNISVHILSGAGENTNDDVITRSLFPAWRYLLP
jgi:hypothetical protein